MKRIVLALFIGIVTVSVNAQTKRWENNIYVDFGGVTKIADEDPYAFHIGYGLNYYFNDHWSLMPGIAFRAKFEPGDADGDEGAYDCSFIDLPIVGQYHLNLYKHNGFVFEAGPVFSFLVSNNQYYVGYLSDKDIYRNFDIGMQASIYLQLGRHWRLGMKGHLGFLDIAKKYPALSESYHCNELTASLDFHF